MTTLTQKGKKVVVIESIIRPRIKRDLDIEIIIVVVVVVEGDQDIDPITITITIIEEKSPKTIHGETKKMYHFYFFIIYLYFE